MASEAAPAHGASAEAAAARGPPAAPVAVSPQRQLQLAQSLQDAGAVEVGTPSMVGGTSYSLDLSDVPADERPARAAEAMEYAHSRLPAGAGFDFSSAAGLKAARYIPFVLP